MNAKSIRNTLLFTAALTLVLGFGFSQIPSGHPSAEATIEGDANVEQVASWPPPAPPPDPGYEYAGIAQIDGQWAWIYEEIDGPDWYYLIIP